MGSTPHLDLQFFFRAAEQLEESTSWPDLWAGRDLSFELMKVSGPGLGSVETLLKARFPRLRYLSLSTLPDAVLPLIEQAELPALEILDLRFDMISGEALQAFSRTAREHLPSLREVGVEMYTGERVEYNDWNGAVVGGYEVQYSPEELERMYLEGTGLTVMREAPSW